MSLASDERGQLPAKGISLAVGLLLAAVVGAVMIPIAIDSIEGDSSVTIEQNTTTTEEVNGELNATLDSVDTAATPSTATYTLQTDGQSITNTIGSGENATYAFDRGDVVVSVTNVETGSATAEYDYPRDFAYSDGARSLWGILGMVIVLGLVLFLIGKALDYV